MGFWNTLLAYCRPHRRGYLVAMGCAAVVGATVALQPLALKWIVDDGLLRSHDGVPAPADERLRWTLLWAGAYAAVSALRMAVGVAGMHATIRTIEHILCDLRARFFRHVQSLCQRFHEEVSSGELFNYIMGGPLQSLKQFLYQGAVAIPIQAVSWVVLIGTLGFLDWRMTLATVAVVLVQLLVNLRSRGAVREISADFLRTENDVSRYVGDMLRGARSVKMYAIEDDISDRFDGQLRRIRDEGTVMGIRRMHHGALAEGLQYAGIAALYAYGGYLVAWGGMAVGTFVAFAASVAVLMGNLNALLQLGLLQANAEAGLERIERILGRPSSTPEPQAASVVADPAARIAACPHGAPLIAVDGLRFAYQPGTWALDGVSVEIAAGSSVALVGSSGSGKSTFARLLQRLYDPQEGSIRIAGTDLRSYPQAQLRGCFGVVPQDPYVFQASIRDNAAILAPDSSDAAVWEALERAQLAEHVRSLPDGLRTWVGEGGGTLSGGQRQRLAIARVILARPGIHLFDEATSALDPDNERRIQRAVQDLTRGSTTLIIAHRLATIRHVDRILVFEGGRIVQDGTWEALAGRPGRFAELLRLDAAAA
ncbi:MAG: ABC transporter ATP-binding protein [Planctomycetes bacterium]|nr:ABC transporter ATP-binding protein [Planctomycetota bacterium]